MATTQYSRRAYRLRDESRDFRSAKVEAVIMIDGVPHSRMALPGNSGLLSVVRSQEGLAIDVVAPGLRVNDLPSEDPSLAVPEAWQLEALRAGR